MKLKSKKVTNNHYRLYPKCEMRMICADYAQKDIDDVELHLQQLIAPKSSHMDFNIACALHFASKCEGYLFNDEYFESV